MAKIDLSSYATKTNRKKLANAYSDLSPLVNIMHITADLDLVAFSSINKVLVFNSSAVNSKSTRDCQGVQVLKSKKGSIMTAVKPLSQVRLNDPDYYRTQNIPAVGCYLKSEDEEEKQLKLDIDV